MKRKIKEIVSLISIFVLLVGCDSVKSTTDSGERIFQASLGSVASEKSNQIEAARMFSAKVNEYTNGSIKINVFPGGQIGSDESMVEELERGFLEFAFLNQGSCAGLDQLFDFHYLPYIARNYKEVDKLFYQNGIIQKTLTETFNKHGIEVLGWYENEYRGISNSEREIKVPQDLKGLKIRVPSSKAIRSYFEELGAQTVTMSMGELYTALQQGTVDGQDNGVLITHDNKLEETGPYYSYTKHVYAMSGIVVSQKMWDKFSARQKEGIIKAAKETQEWQIKASRNQIDEYINTMKSKGITFAELTDDEIMQFAEIADNVWTKMESVYGKDRIDQLRKEVKAVRNN